jgi:hypothetical protein
MRRNARVCAKVMDKGVYRPSTQEDPQRMKALLAKGLIAKELRTRAPMFLTGNTPGWNSIR